MAKLKAGFPPWRYFCKKRLLRANDFAIDAVDAVKLNIPEWMASWYERVRNGSV